MSRSHCLSSWNSSGSDISWAMPLRSLGVLLKPRTLFFFLLTSCTDTDNDTNRIGSMNFFDLALPMLCRVVVETQPSIREKYIPKGAGLFDHQWFEIEARDCSSSSYLPNLELLGFFVEDLSPSLLSISRARVGRYTSFSWV